jgi:hypothetical protein
LKYIKNLVNIGRSSGVFLITSLQKPTNDSLPTDIKAQLTTRVSLIIKDMPTSMVIMGDGSATDLKEREFICRTLETVKGYSFTIDHNIVMEHIKKSIVQKPAKTEALESPKSNYEDVLNKLYEITREGH